MAISRKLVSELVMNVFLDGAIPGIVNKFKKWIQFLCLLELLSTPIA